MKNKDIKDTIYKNVYQNASNGYVLTPSELAFEMVSTLPNSVFQSETTTFLDPICKSGTFLFEIVEKLYSEGHSVSNIQSRIFTVDANSHSLNVANYYIKKLINKESGIFKVDYKSDFLERLLNRVVVKATKGKFKTLEDFFNIILLDKKDIYLMTELKNSISEFIEKYEKVSKLESKLFGEVFTPRQLIDEMLDTLPEEVWKDPNRKWLDPAVGIGNFPAAIMDRLMVGLEQAIPSDDNRRKHILEEMLYMCDISTKNLFLLYMLFDKNNEYKLNVYRGSFLEEGFDKHMKEVWGLEGFDVVVGNPPYQETNDTGTRKTGGSNLYTKFIRKAFNFTNFLLFITPPTWMNTGSNEIDIFSKNQIHFLNINECKKYFNVGSEFSYFLLEKSSVYKPTKLICEFKKNIYSSEVYLKDFTYLPMLLDNKTLSIYNKTLISDNFDFNINFKFDHRREYISKDFDDRFHYKLKHTSKQYRYSSIEHPAQYRKKVLFSRSGNLNPEYDNGEVGTTDGIMWIEVDNEKQGNNLINYFKSDLIKFILLVYKWNGFNDVTILKKLPKIDLNQSFSNNEIYEKFQINKEEIDFIEKIIFSK